MDYVGKYLKKTRIEKKISLKEVTNNLKISCYILNKIEDDDFSEDSDNVYMIGHIRSYAKLLKLDQNALVDKFKSQISHFSDTNEVELPKPIEVNNFFNISRSVSFFSFLFISIGFYFFFIRSNDLSSNYAITPDLTPDLEAEIEEIRLTNDLENLQNKEKEFELAESNNENNLPTPSNLFIIQENDKNNISQIDVFADIPSQNDIIDNLDNSKITLKFLNPTWIQIRDSDNKVILSKLMQINDKYSYFLKDNFYLTTGNAGNIIIFIDDIAKGKVGKKGEVIESLLINSDFNN